MSERRCSIHRTTEFVLVCTACIDEWCSIDNQMLSVLKDVRHRLVLLKKQGRVVQPEGLYLIEKIDEVLNDLNSISTSYKNLEYKTGS